MRTIENASLQTMSSPARLILDSLHRALINIAPEREAEFNSQFPEFTIQYIDDDNFTININTPSKLITISSFVAEFLWVSAYSHFVFYREIFQGQKFKNRKEISLECTPRLKTAMELLSWGTDKLLGKSVGPWPTGLPQPNFYVDHASDERIADEFAMGATACLIHHELAHLHLQHSGKSTIDIEREADANAWEWVLGTNIDLESKAGKKRLLLLTHAYSPAVIKDIHNGYTTLLTHPRSIDRVFNLLSRVNTPKNHIAYAFAFAAFHLHLENSKKGLPQQNAAYDTIAESLEAVINHISFFPTIE
jgi:Peptidase U49